MNLDNLDYLFKPDGIKCPKCGSKYLVEYIEDDCDEEEVNSYLFTCEDCNYDF